VSVRDKLLLEYQAGYTGNAFSRPDSSGIRGKGLNRKAYQMGDDEYPYGKGQPTYGTPQAYSRDSSGHGGTHQNVPVPKGIGSDDGRWSADVDEALGVPFNVDRAGRGTGGAGTGGRVAPGSSGQWSARPTGGQWDNKLDDDELEKYGRTDEYNFGMPFAGNVAAKVNPHTGVSSDDEKIPSANIIEPGKKRDYMKMYGGSKFSTGPGTFGKNNRSRGGTTFRENLHRSLVEAFISLKDTPCASKEQSSGVHDVELDFINNMFNGVVSQARDKMSSMDDQNKVKFLFALEPDHFANSFGELGKDKIGDMYEKWISDASSRNGEDLEKMAEKIAKVIIKMER